MKYSAIITAAGLGLRAGLDKPKTLFEINGVTVIEKTVTTFLRVEIFDEIIVTAPKDYLGVFENLLLPLSPKIKVIVGGATRSESVFTALKTASGEIVAIHDGARPFVSENLIERCLETTKKYKTAIPVLPLTDTLGFIEDGKLSKTERGGYFAIQTPQVFLTEEILTAYKTENGGGFTDDSGLYCKYYGECKTVDGEPTNRKLTYPDDFIEFDGVRVGTGFDLHKLVEGRKLILGGIEIPHSKGLLGHSDADVLVHAIMDALLSACALRDIGCYFPDTDERYKGISSTLLLEKVLELVKKAGFAVNNVSACVMAEKPKLKGYVDEIRKSLASALGIDVCDVGLSCTTLEGVGLVGREEAIAVQAYCSVKKIS